MFSSSKEKQEEKEMKYNYSNGDVIKFKTRLSTTEWCVLGRDVDLSSSLKESLDLNTRIIELNMDIKEMEIFVVFIDTRNKVEFLHSLDLSEIASLVFNTFKYDMCFTKLFNLLENRLGMLTIEDALVMVKCWPCKINIDQEEMTVFESIIGHNIIDHHIFQYSNFDILSAEVVTLLKEYPDEQVMLITLMISYPNISVIRVRDIQHPQPTQSVRARQLLYQPL
jgi:hypothetical protein